jgi:cytidylate kinase
MAKYTEPLKYVPGTYARQTPDAANLANRYIREWDDKRLELKAKSIASKFPPAVCFSRKIGVGALEIADMLAARIGCRVVDHQILEYIAGEAKLQERTVAFFDERYPGRLAELLAMAFGEKAFTESDYTRHLFSAAFAIAGLGPTIFVGRGTHLLLPRDMVLAVRFISCKEHRIRRLVNVLGITDREAEDKLDQSDREQRAFYRKVYGRKDASPYEFDLVINCDYITHPGWAADVVEKAFQRKFKV